MGFYPVESAHRAGSSKALSPFYVSIALVALSITSTVDAQEPPIANPAPAVQTDGERPLQFAFEGAPWRDVIKWLATECDLALHVANLPTGSFSYSDPSSFTHQEAIDRVNLFLLPQGFTLVRSGQLLSVIDLADPRSMQQLDALAKLVSLEQLDQLESYEVVKCFFPLGDFEAEEAVQELSSLQLMTTPAVFSKTNRLLIADTAGKLKSVRAILEAFQPSTMDDGTIVKSFALQHVSAEDILVVARPHLGLATGEMIGIDVSLSADLQGKNIFVTGVEDKVTLIESLIADIDKPNDSLSTTSGEAELRSHLVEGGNVETVYDVLQTLLAGKSVRLSVDETASSVVALASPEIQAEIEATVTQLQASEAVFEVIPLKTVDPHFAVSLLEEMLDLAELRQRASAGMEAFTRHGNTRGLELARGNSDVDVPKIDADPGNMQLFVLAKKPQLEQIKNIITELEAGNVGTSDELRFLPLQGKQAERLLVTAANFWREPNPIVLYGSTEETEPVDTERVVNGEATKARPAAISPPDAPNVRWLTDHQLGQAPVIQCQLTTRGLLLQSEDTEAVDKFEELLRTIAGPFDSTPSPPIVFYLKYARPDDALRILAELLDGGEAAKEGEAGSLVNAYVSSGSSGSFLNSILISREGTTTLMAGSITVVADSRLNRLIAQGTTTDIELIEDYLTIIDKDSSITSVAIHGTSHVIELRHTRASEVAAAIRDAYAGRVAAATGIGGQNPKGSPQEGQREGAEARSADGNRPTSERRSAEKKPAAGAVKSLEPTMTIAVHEPSNSLIVTAPDYLFKEVEQLAQLIDSRSEETVEAIAPIGSDAVKSMLQNVLSNGASTSRGRTGATSRPPSRGNSGR